MSLVANAGYWTASAGVAGNWICHIIQTRLYHV